MSGDRPVPVPFSKDQKTVRCCDHWPVLVFLTEAPGILRLRLTITYHEGRGSEKQVLIPQWLLNRARQQAATKSAFQQPAKARI